MSLARKDSVGGAAFLFLGCYVFLVLVRPHEFLPWLEGIPVVLVAELLAIVAWFSGPKQIRNAPVLSVIFLTLAIAVSWVTLSMTIGLSKTFDFLVGQAFVVILVSNLALTPDRHKQLFKLLVFAAFVMSMHAISQIANEDRVGWTGVRALVRYDSGEEPVWQARYVGIFRDPNDMGMLLAAVFPIIVYNFFHAKSMPTKGFWAAVFLVVLEGTYLCNSRGTILAVIAPTMLYLLIRYNLLKAAIPFMLLVPVIIAIVPSRFFISNDESSQGRIDAWYEGYLMFKSNPFFGVGMGNFTEYHHKTAHNSWVLAYAELGFVGFYFWMLMIFSGLYGIYFLHKQGAEQFEGDSSRYQLFLKERAIAATTFYSFIAILSAAFFLSRTYSFLLYFYAGLSTALIIRMARDFPEIIIPKIQLKVFAASFLFILLIALLVMFKS